MSVAKNVWSLRITLSGSEPMIWRHVLLKSEITLHKLHEIIQGAMGWENSHLYEFSINGIRYGLPDPEAEVRSKDSKKAKLKELLSVGDRFKYIYDFGDGWQHEIVVEGEKSFNPFMRYPTCTAGENACPPEDCGGLPGYQNLLETLSNPKDFEYGSMMEWVGGFFDPKGFDLNHINQDRLWRGR